MAATLKLDLNGIAHGNLDKLERRYPQGRNNTTMLDKIILGVLTAIGVVIAVFWTACALQGTETERG